jgi:two-component system sensor histidine kinase KdpD
VAGASLAYNFFFLPPLHTFTIADPTNVASFLLFTIVAVLVSNLAARVRLQAVTAQGRARTTEALYAFSRKLASVATLDDALWVTAYQMASMLQLRVVLLLPDHNGSIEVRAGYPPEDMLDAADLAAAKWTFEHDHPAGRGADTLPGAKRLFVPMRTGRGAIGVVGLDGDRQGPLLTPEQRRLLDALADQAALAIERVNLVEDVESAKRAAETDRLRQALLTSISHDLKTPLAAILGAAGTLRDFPAFLDDETRAELVGTIQDESERLNRFIANLLDMTRLESGALAPKRAPHDLGEIVGTALQRAGKVLSGHRIEVDLSADLPMVEVDPVLFEQALFNLLDNAAKYAPAGTTVRIDGHPDGAAHVRLRVMDEGDGIPPDELEQVFEKFHRAEKGDRVRAGTGLGLAICRGFVEAMGGTIVAGNRTDRSGAAFTIRLPAAASAAQLDDVA